MQSQCQPNADAALLRSVQSPPDPLNMGCQLRVEFKLGLQLIKLSLCKYQDWLQETEQSCDHGEL